MQYSDDPYCFTPSMYIHTYIHTCLQLEYTVNGERFPGPNFHVFRGFQEHHESFPVNIYLYYTSFV